MLPEQGQLVQVRNRRYAVVDVVQSSMVSSLGAPVQHLVNLASIEDDGLGEELSVVWEIEPGARVFERGTLPEMTGFDPPGRYEAFMNAVRWGVIAAGKTRELQAPFRAAIEVQDYQLEPLVRALQMPRVNLLIADDVGLGKTIEAGLVAFELLLRHRIRRIVIVCPSSLQVQWHEQMRDKFGLDFRIVDSMLMKDLRRKRGLHVNPWTHFPRLIASMDYLKRDRPLRMLQEILPGPDEETFPRRFDLLIVDEAHNVAPPGLGNYAIDSQRTNAIRTLVPHFEHKLFLTATPHNGYTESFAALLELLDDQRFARGIEIEQKQIRAVMVRRLKTELTDPMTGKSKFPKRVLYPLEIEYEKAELQAHADLREYTRLRKEGVKNGAERTATEFVLKLLKKRFFSSPAAFASTLDKHMSSLGKHKGAKRAPAVASESVLRKHIDRLDEDFGDDTEFEESTQEAVEHAGIYFREPTAEEQKLLTSLKKFADTAAARADSKAKKLLIWIYAELMQGKQWTDRRLLVFTEYRDTQNWLIDLLSREGLVKGDRILTLYGGMPTKDREEIKAAFQADPRESNVRILLATDAASEGIDLQNHCSRIIHFEIPWNPNRLEQRNGRLDRHGQRADEVSVYHFVGVGYDKIAPGVEKGNDLAADLEFLYRAARKVETIREDLGKVGPVIARQVSDAMLGKSRKLDTGSAEESASGVRKLLKWERDLKEQLRDLRDQVEETRVQLHANPEQIKAVVDAGLALASKPGLRQVPGKGNESLFHIPELSGSWARALDGLKHPHTHVVRPITFDPNRATGKDDVVLAHLNHPLVRLSANLLRSEIWSAYQEKKVHRITCKSVPRGTARAVAVLLHARLVILGNDQERLHEELLVTGGYLEAGAFQRIKTQKELAELDSVESMEPASEKRQKEIKELWPKITSGLEKALEARVKERTENLNVELFQRRHREITDISAILNELKSRIEAELNKEENAQMLLGFDDNEKIQYRRDREHLQRRLKAIPDEIVAEKKKIENRYLNPVPRVFPVGISILVPQNLDH